MYKSSYQKRIKKRIKMKINDKPSNNLSRKILKAGAIAATAIIPAVYMTKFHVDMFKKDDEQNRAIMRNKMLGFFAGIGLSVLLVHKRVKIGSFVVLDSKNDAFKQVAKIILAGIAPFAGLEIAKIINKKLYPEKFKGV